MKYSEWTGHINYSCSQTIHKLIVIHSKTSLKYMYNVYRILSPWVIQSAITLPEMMLLICYV